MDKEVLREIMGHADFETTEFYYIFISAKRKKEEFKKATGRSLNDLYKSKSDIENNAHNKIKVKKVGYTGKKIQRKKIKAPLQVSA